MYALIILNTTVCNNTTEVSDSPCEHGYDRTMMTTMMMLDAVARPRRKAGAAEIASPSRVVSCRTIRRNARPGLLAVIYVLKI